MLKASMVFGKPVQVRHGPATVSGDDGYNRSRTVWFLTKQNPGGIDPTGSNASGKG